MNQQSDTVTSPAPAPAPAPAPHAMPARRPGSLMIHVGMANEDPQLCTYIILMPTTKLSRVHEKFCECRKLDPTKVTLKFNGTRLDGDQTAGGLNMVEGDVVTATIRPEGFLIRIEASSCIPVTCRVKLTTKFDKIHDAYCSKVKMCNEHVRLMYQGAQISGDQTPGDLGMAEGALITAETLRRSGRSRVERAPNPAWQTPNAPGRAARNAVPLEELSTTVCCKVYAGPPPAMTFDEAHYRERAQRAADLTAALVDPTTSDGTPDMILAARMQRAEDGSFTGRCEMLVSWQGWDDTHAVWLNESQFAADRGMWRAIAREMRAVNAKYGHTQLATP